MRALDKTFAAHLFDVTCTASVAECDLFEALHDRYEATYGDAHEHTFDYYDASIEIYLPGVTDREPEYEFAFSLGFKLCWVHDHIGGRRLPDGSLCKCPAKRVPR